MHRDVPQEPPPQPSAALYIPNSPMIAQTAQDQAVKPAAFSGLGEQAGTPPASDPAPPLLQHPMRVLYQRASQTYSRMDSYIYRLRRREVVAGSKRPEEVIQVKVRRQPFSVYLKWLGEEGKGREVIYVRGKNDDKMEMILGASDVLLLPAGMRFSLSPDDKMARGKSRYPITETGFGPLIERYGQMIAAIERGDVRGGTAKYLGRTKRPEFLMPVETVLQVMPAKSDPLLPRGGERFWYFDATSGLPVLLITNEGENEPRVEVEYYCHDNIQFPVNLDDLDFNPEWLRRK